MKGNSRLSKTIWIWFLIMLCVAGCAGSPAALTPTQTPPAPVSTSSATAFLPSPTWTPAPTVSSTPFPNPTATLLPSSTPTVKPTLTPQVSGSIDLVAWSAAKNGAWFSAGLGALPTAKLIPSASFSILDSTIGNRKNGKIAPTLLGGYVFMQFGEVTPYLFQQHVNTIGACFFRTILFVDYAGNRTLNWDRISTSIPMDFRSMIRICNQRNNPVFLQFNYSDYVPGPVGTGMDALQKADNVARTIEFISSLKPQGLRIDGLTFGDEIGDESGFGSRKPTLQNSDLIDKFIAFARAIKQKFPDLKIYAFDSYIAATRGQVSSYWEHLQKIRQAEVRENMILIDGFVFRESYTYIDENRKVLDSQYILDDTESLYRDAPVYRYDVFGNTNKNTDRDYLHRLIDQTRRIFGRDLDIGITEYLPAGPVQIDESDTSAYADMDFILHYSDVVGIYAELGLDTVSTWMFANSNKQAECYIDKFGRQGANYPIHAQLAQYFSGGLLKVDRSVDYDHLKVKAYAARKDSRTFIMLLNKDVVNEAVIKVNLPGIFDLNLRLPRRSYSSLLVEGNKVTVSGIGK